MKDIYIFIIKNKISICQNGFTDQVASYNVQLLTKCVYLSLLEYYKYNISPTMNNDNSYKSYFHSFQIPFLILQLLCNGIFLLIKLL